MYFANMSVIEHKRVACCALCFCGLSCHGVSGGRGGWGGSTAERPQSGEFNCREKLHSRGWVDIHTGTTIDAVWKELKKYVPTSINNQPQVLNVYVRQFQWRFCHCHEKDLMAYTAAKLAHA